MTASGGQGAGDGNVERGLDGASLRVRCPAKINTILRVLGRREDGYHELDTEFVTLELSDSLSLEPGEGFSLALEGPHSTGVPVEENLVVKAGLALRRELGASAVPGARARLVKEIPAAAGLGGGSSDAAGMLLGLVRLFSLEPPPGLLPALALELGSDVPYFLEGGRCRGRGRGELLESLPERPERSVLLARPRRPLSTAAVFAAHARRVESGEPAPWGVLTRRKPSSSLVFERWWESQDWLLHDDLRAAAFELAPELVELESRLHEAFPDGDVGLTGSGPTLYVLGPEAPAGEDRVEIPTSLRRLEVDLLPTRTLSRRRHRASRFDEVRRGP